MGIRCNQRSTHFQKKKVKWESLALSTRTGKQDKTGWYLCLVCMKEEHGCPEASQDFSVLVKIVEKSVLTDLELATRSVL